MAVVDTGGLRKVLTIELDNELVRIVEYQHIKQGRGSAFIRLTMRNLRTAARPKKPLTAARSSSDICRRATAHDAEEAATVSVRSVIAGRSTMTPMRTMAIMMKERCVATSAPDSSK